MDKFAPSLILIGWDYHRKELQTPWLWIRYCRSGKRVTDKYINIYNYNRDQLSVDPESQNL